MRHSTTASSGDFSINDKKSTECEKENSDDGWLYGIDEQDALIDELLSSIQTRLERQADFTLDDTTSINGKGLCNQVVGSVRTTNKLKNNVRFSEIACIIPRCEEEYKYDPRNCWYTSEEMGVIYSEIRSTLEISKCQKDNALNEDQFCLRGLEDVILTNRKGKSGKCSSLGRIQCKRRKQKEFVNTILDWLRVQRASTVSNDPTGLMMFSSACSKHSRQKARARAAQDFLEAQEILNVAGCRSLLLEQEGNHNHHLYLHDIKQSDDHESKSFDILSSASSSLGQIRFSRQQNDMNNTCPNYSSYF